MARYFKYILTFILLISSLGGYGQQMYDGSGSLLGRYDNGKLYNRSGAYEGQINSQRFYSRSGSYLGNESNGKYYDYSGAYIGYTGLIEEGLVLDCILRLLGKKPEFIELNKKAFSMGLEAGKKAKG